MPVAEEMYRSHDLLVIARTGYETSFCVVTFDSFTDRRTLDREGFGEGFFASRGVNAIHVLSRDNDWYLLPDIELALDAAAKATASFDRVLAYGRPPMSSTTPPIATRAMSNSIATASRSATSGCRIAAIRLRGFWLKSGFCSERSWKQRREGLTGRRSSARRWKCVGARHNITPRSRSVRVRRKRNWSLRAAPMSFSRMMPAMWRATRKRLASPVETTMRLPSSTRHGDRIGSPDRPDAALRF